MFVLTYIKVHKVFFGNFELFTDYSATKITSDAQRKKDKTAHA